MNTDPDLLDYITTGSEQAFRRIVERYAPMVHGVASRMTRNQPLAEEVTQSVFILLARKVNPAAAASLSGWLYNTAVGMSRNAVRKESRRKALHEQYLLAMDDIEAPCIESWKEMAPHLDEAVSRLSTADRKVMILRYFEQRTFPEISRALGASEEACKKRAQRALERLGTLLGRRGVAATSGAAIAAAIGAFAMTPPAASAATLSGMAISSTGSSTTLATLFKFLKLQTAHSGSTTAAALPIMKILTILPPVLALAAGTLWALSRQQAIASLEARTRVLQEAVQARQTAGLENPVATAKSVQSGKSGKIDWLGILRKGNGGVILSDEIVSRLKALSADELLAELDALSKQDLGGAKAAFEGLVITELGKKDPAMVMEYLGDRIGEKGIFYQALGAFKEWVAKDPVEAAKWMDRRIAAGTFETTTLDGHNPLRENYETLVTGAVFKTDPEAARARLMQLTDAERGEVFNSMFIYADASGVRTMVGLMRTTLPAAQWTEALGRAAYGVGERGLDQIGSFVRDIGATGEERAEILPKAISSNAQDKSSGVLADPAKFDAGVAWLTKEFPDQAGTVTGQALGQSYFKGGFQASSDLALKYQAAGGGDDVMVAFLQGEAVPPRDAINLLDKINDPTRREELRTILETRAKGK
jgi:RNA polymerase sigma factor (sigma-70 family)